jgi:hypothetical protein
MTRYSCPILPTDTAGVCPSVCSELEGGGAPVGVAGEDTSEGEGAPGSDGGARALEELQVGGWLTGRVEAGPEGVKT